MRAAPLLLVLLSAGACLLPGPESLVDDANVELIVTGVVPGDRMTLAIDQRVFQKVARADDAVRFFLELPPGSHEGRLRVERRATALCAAFAVQAPPAGERTTTSASLADARPCETPGPGEEEEPDEPDEPDVDEPDEDDEEDAPDAGAEPDRDAGGGPPDAAVDPDEEADDPDAGVEGEEDAGPEPPEDAGAPPDAGAPSASFGRVRESVVEVPCGTPPCASTTTIGSDGTLTFEQEGDTQTGTVSESDLQALESELLSPEADALFAGEDPDCPTGEPNGSESVQLERQVQRLDGSSPELVTERVDATGCDTGIAASIRARLAFLRELVLP